MLKTLKDVCLDESCGGVWKFDPRNSHYMRVQNEGTISAVISGKFLPNPNDLWKARCDQFDVAEISDMGKKLKPQKVTFDLWEHWKGASTHAHNNI